MTLTKEGKDFVKEGRIEEAIRTGEELAAGIGIGHLSALYAHLGNLSHWSDERIIYDERTRKITNSEKADSMITPEYRPPWIFPVV